MRLSTVNVAGWTLDKRQRFVFGAVQVMMLVGILPASLRATSPPRACPSKDRIYVVNIIPESLSGETGYDSEPNVAVNPINPAEIAASAFTREPMGGKTAPIFVSTDGGKIWSCRSIVPSPQITCDITLRFGSSSNVLYVSALRNQIRIGGQKLDPFELMVCQSGRFANARLMDEIANGRKGIDQPYIAAVTLNLKDRAFVGENDINAPNGRSATIEGSLDACQGGFTPLRIERRDTAGKDSAEVRPAISSDGRTVYAVFNSKTEDHDDTRVGDVIVVRDDNGGASTSPFTALVDPCDNLPGFRVVRKRTFAWDLCLGGDRLGGDLAIAVHPGDRNKVCVVWSDWVGGHANLHLKCSANGGKDWSDGIRDIADAKNPGLAINKKGTLGFLYQQVVGGTWITQFERTNDDFKSPANVVTLAKFPVSEFTPPSPCNGNLFLGDYLHLMSVGDDFYGIFSSSNVPDCDHFPSGVIFQRKANFTTKELLDDQDKEVDPSIDPYFFKVQN